MTVAYCSWYVLILHNLCANWCIIICAVFCITFAWCLHVHSFVLQQFVLQQFVHAIHGPILIDNEYCVVVYAEWFPLASTTVLHWALDLNICCLKSTALPGVKMCWGDAQMLLPPVLSSDEHPPIPKPGSNGCTVLFTIAGRGWLVPLVLGSQKDRVWVWEKRDW